MRHRRSRRFLIQYKFPVGGTLSEKTHLNTRWQWQSGFHFIYKPLKLVHRLEILFRLNCQRYCPSENVVIEMYKNSRPNIFIRISLFVWYTVFSNIRRILDDFIGIPRKIIKMEKSSLNRFSTTVNYCGSIAIFLHWRVYVKQTKR